jgi:hypothetical protein
VATPRRRADLIFATALTALALWVLVESWRMPRLSELGVHPMSAPGLTPGLLSLILAGLGLTLLWRSLRAPATPAAPDHEAPVNTPWWRAVLALGLCLVYALGLLGHLPFLWATGLFVFAFIVGFSFKRDRWTRMLFGAALTAVVVAVGVSFLFEQVFLVRLP